MSDSRWSFDIDEGKKHKQVLIALYGNSGYIVLQSRWLAEIERWEFTSKKNNIILAWQPWPEFP